MSKLQKNMRYFIGAVHLTTKNAASWAEVLYSRVAINEACTRTVQYYTSFSCLDTLSRDIVMRFLTLELFHQTTPPPPLRT
jgi:hypothetical protein